MYWHFLALFAMYGDIFFKYYEGKSFLFPTATDNVEYKTDLGVNILLSDEFELEISGSSEPELWSFQVDPSRAGALQFSS